MCNGGLRMNGLLKGRKAKAVRADIIFYAVVIAFPLLQFSVFYIGVNFNSFLLTFQEINIAENRVYWVGFRNLGDAFYDMTHASNFLYMWGTSFKAWLISFVIGSPLALLFSYYIYKKLPAYGFFRVVLFLPSIVSAIVMVTIFQFFAERAVPEIVLKLFGEQVPGLLENRASRFATVMFYNIWIGFGVSVLMYSDSMNGIDAEITEAAGLDGATGAREFFYITFPLVYPTFSTFIVVGVAGIFTNQINLYSFFGAAASDTIMTYGYYLYVRASSAMSDAEYPYLAAVGVWLTVIAVPLTFAVKYALEKFGPKTD